MPAISVLRSQLSRVMRQRRAGEGWEETPRRMGVLPDDAHRNQTLLSLPVSLRGLAPFHEVVTNTRMIPRFRKGKNRFYSPRTRPHLKDESPSDGPCSSLSWIIGHPAHWSHQSDGERWRAQEERTQEGIYWERLIFQTRELFLYPGAGKRGGKIKFVSIR